MTIPVKAYVGASIFCGHTIHENSALAVHSDGTLSIASPETLPQSCLIETMAGGIISPGFVDLQVNGGGGIMFNDDPTVDGLRTIAQAHAALGTAALLPTLITDTPDQTNAALDAVKNALLDKITGIIGLHLEGPHLSHARAGAHDPSLIRPMEDADLKMLLDAANHIPNLMVTVAPENTTNIQIRALTEAGIVVSLGHTNASYDICMAAFDAGASCVTHLFNAMSQFQSRDPGLVGAALTRGEVHAGLIADGIHVDPRAITIALAAKQNPEKIFLVTDAMAPAGTDIDGFELNGRRIERKNSRLTLANGTLAGAELDMTRAVSLMTNETSDDLSKALCRATSYPAAMLRDQGDAGSLFGVNPTVIHMNDEFATTVVLTA